jgi:hypothetical protein
MYLNYQATLLEDRLTVLAGYREEKQWERGQYQPNNLPLVHLLPGHAPRSRGLSGDVWGHSINYQRGLYVRSKG